MIESGLPILIPRRHSQPRILFKSRSPECIRKTFGRGFFSKVNQGSGTKPAEKFLRGLEGGAFGSGLPFLIPRLQFQPRILIKSRPRKWQGTLSAEASLQKSFSGVHKEGFRPRIVFKSESRKWHQASREVSTGFRRPGDRSHITRIGLQKALSPQDSLQKPFKGWHQAS